MSKFKIEILAEIFDKDGKLLGRQPWRPINTLLKQFIQTLCIQLSQASVTMKNTAGDEVAYAAGVSAFRANAPAGNTTYGLLIGTGTTPVAMDNHKIETQLSANVAHALGSYLVENPDASTCRVAITRVFTNNTGATIHIKEVALHATTPPATAYVCLDRTLYSVSVPNGENLALTYRITVTL